MLTATDSCEFNGHGHGLILAARQSTSISIRNGKLRFQYENTGLFKVDLSFLSLICWFLHLEILLYSIFNMKNSPLTSRWFHYLPQTRPLFPWEEEVRVALSFSLVLKESIPLPMTRIKPAPTRSRRNASTQYQSNPQLINFCRQAQPPAKIRHVKNLLPNTIFN